MEKTNPSGLNIPQAHEEKQSADHAQVMKQTFMDKHRNASKNWHVPFSFSSEAVISTYSYPQVDKSTEPFTWGKPYLHYLHRLCWEMFGLHIQKSDELLLPVLKKYNKYETQLRLEAFYSFNERFAKIHSKRFKKAVKGITGNQYSNMIDDLVEEVYKSRSGNIFGKSSDIEPQKHSKRTASRKSKPKWSSKRTAKEHASPEVKNIEEPIRHCSDRGFLRNGKGRGRGQGRGRGNANLCSELLDPSSCDVDSGHDEHEVHVDESSGPHELRKSTRLRKPLNYTVNYLEIYDVEKSLEGEMVALASKTMNNLEWEILHFRASLGIILKGEMDFPSMERKLFALV